jgi:hypothetical protein
MGVALPPQTRLEQQYPTITPSDTDRAELDILREQNQHLRDLVVYLSRIVVRQVLEK